MGGVQFYLNTYCLWIVLYKLYMLKAGFRLMLVLGLSGYFALWIQSS